MKAYQCDCCKRFFVIEDRSYPRIIFARSYKGDDQNGTIIEGTDICWDCAAKIAGDIKPELAEKLRAINKP